MIFLKKPLIILTGPTAVGKTKLSISLAKAVNGAIISADSMQVYRHMDIGSAKITPDEIRIPVYIVIIATLVTIIQMLIQAFAPALNESLGVFIPLIVVNCIILGRAESFASKNGIVASAIDGIGMGLGYTLAVLSMSLIREVLSTGGILITNPFNTAQVLLNVTLFPEDFTISLFGSPVGAFITFACLASALGAYKMHLEAKEKAKEK